MRNLILLSIISLWIFCGFLSSDVYGNLEWKEETLTLDARGGEINVFGSYHFQNMGPKAVHIVDVHTSCSDCTEAGASKSTLAPGEKGEIQVVFHADRQVDAKDKQVFVKTDDGSPEK